MCVTRNNNKITMTTKARAELYEAEHRVRMENKRWAVYNPKKKDLDKLPIIYGFNNGGSIGMLSACLVAEDGTGLGSHACSSEGYMEHDLGILEGTRADRHETFKKHYPNGYRMEFVGYGEAKEHKGLKKAFELNEKLEKSNPKK